MLSVGSVDFGVALRVSFLVIRTGGRCDSGHGAFALNAIHNLLSSSELRGLTFSPNLDCSGCFDSISTQQYCRSRVSATYLQKSTGLHEAGRATLNTVTADKVHYHFMKSRFDHPTRVTTTF